MVEIKSPTNIKEMEGKLGVSFRGIAGKLTDKNIWINKEKNEWSLLLEEHNIRALAPAYNYIIVPYNKPRKNLTKDVGKRKSFYVV